MVLRGFGEGLGFRERTMVRELQPGVVLVEVMADGGGEVVDEGTEGQVVLQSLNGVATCTGGSRGGLGVGDGEDGRRDGGDDGFKEIAYEVVPCGIQEASKESQRVKICIYGH